ncbi:TetR/AcrR family transcriptional regulator [Streptomyces yunnanensis]|uniref:Transcriptional regulator, TetR family n=1 Tax=Streptomyces yunnanensis TaxID=156453 RepID=A0A9X8R0K4_9ACTN|nr:TetR/AcrR family transcriptional regulator [Streptomyces yunnanensis]SHN34943.1 transcriptional regulator, TetR family [Streptomyces yunnanensis]
MPVQTEGEATEGMTTGDREGAAQPGVGGRPRQGRIDAAVIAATLDLIGQDGATLSGLSLVAVAQRAGVSRGSLYRRWPDKNALLADVLTAVTEPHPLVPLNAPLRERLLAVAEGVARRARDPRARRLLRLLAVEQDQFPTLAARYERDVLAPRRASAIDLITSAQHAGEIRSDVAPEVILTAVTAPALALTFTASDRNQPDLDAQIDLLITGLRPTA